MKQDDRDGKTKVFVRKKRAIRRWAMQNERKGVDDYWEKVTTDSGKG